MSRQHEHGSTAAPSSASARRFAARSRQPRARSPTALKRNGAVSRVRARVGAPASARSSMPGSTTDTAPAGPRRTGTSR